ncbi:MAG: glycosyltransferase [Bacteroidota bacterium]
MQLLFWISFAIIFYTFIGYGLVLYLLIRIKRMVAGKPKPIITGADYKWPTVSFIVAAYNEEYILNEKILNSLQLDYPADLMEYIVITDGSTDGSGYIVSAFSQVKLMHLPGRNGKLAAMERAIAAANGEILIFSDANTFLNKEAIQEICKHYNNNKTGAVAGEKKVMTPGQDDAVASESMYWKYESTLKKWDSELYSVVGAAGELFSVRKSLYIPVPKDTILDDFMISLRIAEKGYKVVYEPKAYAAEFSSENVAEEYKRKVRIAAGGIQSILRLKALLLPFPQPVLWFQYISHRVLRWTVTPFLLVLLYIINFLIIIQRPDAYFYWMVFVMQTLFYCMAMLGWYFENKSIKVKIFFIPFYFCMMNVAVIAGIKRYFSGRQSVKWEKAKRRVV